MRYLRLVNQRNTLAKEYVPQDLVQESTSKIWLRKIAWHGFYQMNLEIRKSGGSQLVLVSGYRSYDYQQEVLKRKINGLIKEGLSKSVAIEKARTIVALPGTSEHQTGLAIDLTSLELAKEKDPLIEAFEETNQGKWLDLNAHQYGFILRYPKDKTTITHITYEPWHYRYVGTNHARKIKELGMCLEEYITYLDNHKY